MSDSELKQDSRPSSNVSDEEVIKTVIRHNYVKEHAPWLFQPGVTFTPEQLNKIKALTLGRDRFGEMVKIWARSRGVKLPGESP